MQKLNEEAMENIAIQIVNNLFEDAAMMSMGGSSSSAAATLGAVAPAAGANANGTGDKGVGSSSTSSTDTSQDATKNAESLSNVVSSKTNTLSSKGLSTSRGAHSSIVKDGKSYSLQAIVTAIKAPFAGSDIQTNGTGKLKGSGISVGQMN